jgi:hypothetical protein
VPDELRRHVKMHGREHVHVPHIHVLRTLAFAATVDGVLMLFSETADSLPPGATAS